jgi:cytochrome c peroxidase
MATLADQLTAAQTKLDEYLQAETDALEAQEIRGSVPGGPERTEVMADLRSIRQGITFWQGRVASLQARINGQPTIGGMAFSSARFGYFPGSR